MPSNRWARSWLHRHFSAGVIVWRKTLARSCLTRFTGSPRTMPVLLGRSSGGMDAAPLPALLRSATLPQLTLGEGLIVLLRLLTMIVQDGRFGYLPERHERSAESPSPFRGGAGEGVSPTRHHHSPHSPPLPARGRGQGRGSTSVTCASASTRRTVSTLTVTTWPMRRTMYCGSSGRLGSLVMPLRLLVLMWYWSMTHSRAERLPSR